jgi:5-methylcytosine-specific restriction endonuclease McrA
VGFSRKQRPEIYKKCEGKCGYCGEPIEMKVMQADHIIPQRNFMWHIKNNKWIPEFLRHLTEFDCDNIDNAMPSCRVCNKRKDTYHLELFREELELQPERAAKTSANYRMALKYGQITETKHPIVFYFEKRDGNKINTS